MKEKRDRRMFYCGNSMTGVFRPGDELFWRGVPRRKLRPGDILIFPDGHGRMIVHRVIRCTPDGPVTMGDNNLTADVRGPGRHFAYRKVEQFRRRRFRRHVPSGALGMMQFRRNRIWRMLRGLGGKAIRLIPLRMRIRTTEQLVFGKSIHYRWRGILIAVGDGKTLRFRHPLLRLFFAPERGGAKHE